MLRSVILACFCGISTLLCGQAIGPRIQFEETRHEFGEMVQGADVSHAFRFQNVGDAPLMIVSAKTTCGCDVAKWPKEPIAPGETGEIIYKYDGNRLGGFDKSIWVQTNDSTQLEIRLHNRGNILPKEALYFEAACLEHLLIPQGSTAPIAFPYRRDQARVGSLAPQFHSSEVIAVTWNGVQTAPELDTVWVWFDTQTLGPFSNSLTLKLEMPEASSEFWQTNNRWPLSDRTFIYLHFEGEIVGPEVMAGDGRKR